MSQHDLKDDKKPAEVEEARLPEPQIDFSNSEDENESTDYDKYVKFFKEFNWKDEDVSELIAELKNHRDNQDVVHHNEDYFSNFFEISLIYHTTNYEVLKLQVKMGPFKTNVLVLNSTEMNLTHYLTDNDKSTFATIYYCNSEEPQNSAVIKCFQLNDKSISHSFSNALKEFCFLRIASKLKVGPRMSDIFGFDLVVYEECVEFAMQKCEKVKKFTNEDIHILKQKLLKLHRLKIWHMDIKPDNILMSPSLGELVFIDFGLSDIAIDSLGTKTQTFFLGSMKYCSPDMLNIYNKKGTKADLYYNDVCCLEKSANDFWKKFNGTNTQLIGDDSDAQNESQKEMDALLNNVPKKDIYSSFLVMKCKRMIAENINSILENKTYIQVLLKNSVLFMDFMHSLPYSLFLEKIDLLFLKNLPQLKRQIEAGKRFSRVIHGINFSVPSTLVEKMDQTKDGNYRQYLAEHLVLKLPLEYLSLRKATHNIEIRLEDVVLKKQVFSRLQKYIYFSKFISFVDFRNSNSRTQHKQIAVKAFKYHNRMQAHPESSYLLQLGECMMFLLKSYCKQLHKGIQIYLPILIYNIVILELITAKDLHDLFEYIVHLELTPIKHIKLLFRSLLVLDWIEHSIIQRYKDENLRYEIIDIVNNKLSEYYEMDNSNKLASILIILINIDKKIHPTSEKIVIFGSKIDAVRFGFDTQFRTEVKMYYLSILMEYYSKLADFKSLLVAIEQLYRLQKGSLFHECRFDYYHMRIYNFLKENSSIQILASIYKKCTESIRIKSLIMKLELYYHYEWQIAEKTYLSIFNKLDEILKILEEKKEMVFHGGILSQVMQLVTHHECQSYDPKYVNCSTTIQKLQQIYSFQKLHHFPFPDYNSQEVPKTFENAYNIGLIYIHLHWMNFRLEIQLKKFEKKVLQYYEDIQCEDCKTKSSRSLVFLQILIEYYFGKYEKVYEMLINAINNLQKEDNQFTKSIKTKYLIYLIGFSMRHPQFQEKFNVTKYFYYEMKAMDHLHILISYSRNYKNFGLVNLYLAKKQKNIPEFVSFHENIVSFLMLYPMKEYIQSYNDETCLFLKQNRAQSHAIYLQIKKKFITIKKFNTGIILFFSICISCEHQEDSISLKIIEKIFDSLHLMQMHTKGLILANIHEFIFRTFIVRKQDYIHNRPQSFSPRRVENRDHQDRENRFFLYRYKQSLRYYQMSMRYPEFCRRFQFSTYLQRKMRDRQMYAKIQTKIRSCYENVMATKKLF